MPRKIVAVGLFMIVATLQGCGGAGIGLSRLESSKTAYMRCLEQNPDDPSKCAALRQAYEADLRAHHDTSRGLTRGGLFSTD